jgi:hypothetical protein
VRLPVGARLHGCPDREKDHTENLDERYSYD